LIPGEKNLENAISLVQQVKNRSNGTIPFFTSDERSDFTTALLEVYGEEVVQKYSGRGRPPKPIKIPPSELKYARVRKHRKKGRIVKVDTSVVFGTEDEVNKILKESSVSIGNPTQGVNVKLKSSQRFRKCLFYSYGSILGTIILLGLIGV